MKPAALESKILIVDDTSSGVTALERLLDSAGYVNIRSAKNTDSTLNLLESFRPELVVVTMPMAGTDAAQLVRRIREADEAGNPVPVIVLTSDASAQERAAAVQCGATDFLSKQSDPSEIALRIGNSLSFHRLQAESIEATRALETKVGERTMALWNSQIEVLERLSKVAEFRDDDGPDHNRRVAEISARTARAYGLDNAQVELIRLASPLHDIGKVALPDQLLTKPGKLGPDEFDQMTKHAAIGAEILSGGKTPLLKLAEVIARHHHERWDGSGYPGGLIGEAIPIAARIVAVADVFDSSMIARPYRKALGVEDAMAAIVMSSGTLFDPKVVAAFVEALKSPAERQSLRLVA